MPPYSTEAFYYVEDKNALLKWVSAENSTAIGGVETKGKWIQINSTQAVTEAINGLSDRVGIVENNIVTLNQTIGDSANPGDGTLWKAIKENAADISGNAEDIEKNAEAIEDHEGRLSAVITESGENKSAISEIQGNYNTLSNSVTTLSGTVSEQGEAIAEHTEAIEGINTKLTSDLGTKDDVASESGTAFARIAQLKTDLGTTNGKVSTLESNYNDINGRVQGLETTSVQQGNAISEINGAIVGINAAAELLEGRVGQNETDIAEIKAAIGDGTDGNSITKRLTNVEQKAEENAQNIGTLSNSVTELGKDLEDVEEYLGDASNPAAGTVRHTLSEHATAIETNATDISGLNDRLTPAESAISTLQGEMSDAKGNISDLQGTVATLSSTKADKEAVEEEFIELENALKEQLTEHINAANAMQYKGEVGSKEALDALTNLSVGDTYVVSQGFSNGDDVVYYAGDLLIARGAEENNKITANLEWTHVETGYSSAHEPKLTYKADNSVVLSSHVAPGSGDLGEIAFVADAASSATVKVTNEGTGAKHVATVTVGIEWGSF